MAYLPPHKRHSSTSTPTPTPTPSSLTSSLRSPSLSSPRGRHHPRPTDKIIHAAGCVFRWSAIPSFPPVSDDDYASLRLEPFPCDHIERKTGAKPLALVFSSREGYSDSAEAAAAAIADRLLPDLLAAAERVRASDVPKEEEEVKLGLVARVGKVLFQPGGSPVTLDSLREAAKAWEEGSRSQVRKWFYINVPSEFLDDMERSAVERMGLEFDSSKEHYHVKVFDKHQNDSTLSCKCTVQEDGKLAIHTVELKQVRQLVEDISCLFKDLDLRLMLRTKRILKNLDAEVENAIKSLVSSAVIDRNVKGGLRWTLGKESIGERFSIVGVWHTNYKAFKNQTLRLKLRHADRFDHQSSTGEVSNEVTLGLTGISERLEGEGGGSVLTGNGATVTVRGIRPIFLNLTSGKTLILKDMLYVFARTRNLLSGSLLCRQGIKLVFTSNKVVLTKFGNFVGKGYDCGGIFHLSILDFNNLNIFNVSHYNKSL